MFKCLNISMVYVIEIQLYPDRFVKQLVLRQLAQYLVHMLNRLTLDRRVYVNAINVDYYLLV